MSAPRDRVRIGAGAGFSGDRIEPAVELVRHGDLDVLVFECLAERTVALAQQARMRDPDGGYDPLLDARMRAVLPETAARGVTIVTNMGAANPRAAARRVLAVAAELGLPGLRVAAVTGDDVLDSLLQLDPPLLNRPGRLSDLGREAVVSANAYLGAEPLVQALAAGAQVVVTGRVADPALFLAPLRHAFGWAADDERLGQGLLAGHLLECAGQLTGGYFADPGRKDVPGLARLGFPFADVLRDGSVRLGKVDGSGGRLDVATCTEQLLYEIEDPADYVTPDGRADFSQVRFTETGPDRVEAHGARVRPPPSTLKVSVGCLDGYVGEGQISYAGPGAEARGRLALEIVRERLRITGAPVTDVRFELIGVDALAPRTQGAAASVASEVRARVAGRARTAIDAERIGMEVESLYTNGPAGGGGAIRGARAVLAVESVLMPASLVTPRVEIFYS